MTANINKKQLMAKARGFTMSIEKMTDNQLQQTPSGDYGDDYNRLLSHAKQLYPDLSELLPPPVKFYPGSDGTSRFSEQSYAEINTYCEQIFQLLSGHE